MSFLLFSCVFRWFWRDLVKCYVSVQVTYLLDKNLTGEILERTISMWLKWGAPQKSEDQQQIPRRHTQGRKRTFNPKGAQEVVENRVRRNLQKVKTKDSVEHRATGRDRRV